MFCRRPRCSHSFFVWLIDPAGGGPQGRGKPQVKSTQHSLHGHAQWNISQIYSQELWCQHFGCCCRGEGTGGIMRLAGHVFSLWDSADTQSQGALGGITKITVCPALLNIHTCLQSAHHLFQFEQMSLISSQANSISKPALQPLLTRLLFQLLSGVALV